ncbi:hypothetical protein AAVH_19964 [Aphelenchoides avenae]|nr:hypothetical protein AAVH_19964 [Aphelenchus avenae]
MIDLLLTLTLLGLGSAIAEKDDCYGCPVQLDPKSPQVLELADKVIAKVQANVSLPNCLLREEVYNATSQFFASYEYHLTFRVGHSKCEPPVRTRTCLS